MGFFVRKIRSPDFKDFVKRVLAPTAQYYIGPLCWFMTRRDIHPGRTRIFLTSIMDNKIMVCLKIPKMETPKFNDSVFCIKQGRSNQKKEWSTPPPNKTSKKILKTAMQSFPTPEKIHVLPQIRSGFFCAKSDEVNLGDN